MSDGLTGLEAELGCNLVVACACSRSRILRCLPIMGLFLVT